MENEAVREVVELNFKTGVSAKTGKPWAMHRYVTNSGKEFTSFDDLQIGDAVKLTYSDEYKNWNGGRIRKQDIENDAIHAKLDKILALLEGGKPTGAPTMNGYEQAKAKAQDLRPTKSLDDNPDWDNDKFPTFEG